MREKKIRNVHKSHDSGSEEHPALFPGLVVHLSSVKYAASVTNTINKFFIYILLTLLILILHPVFNQG